MRGAILLAVGANLLQSNTLTSLDLCRRVEHYLWSQKIERAHLIFHSILVKEPLNPESASTNHS